MKRWRIEGLTRRRCVTAFALLIVATVGARPYAAHAESQSPVPNGFLPAGLARVGDYIRNEIATGKIPGPIMLFQQPGQPGYFANFMVRSADRHRPITPDTIF